ncbi:hypothetical protein J6590_043553 [Homalodisca vitripennis]|nr:hypothetical protein J6590_043553 [Homalodisca vitripennis]
MVTVLVVGGRGAAEFLLHRGIKHPKSEGRIDRSSPLWRVTAGMSESLLVLKILASLIMNEYCPLPALIAAAGRELADPASKMT